MKFQPIVQVDDALWRERVIARVLEAPPSSARVTLVSAPAGFGKTTLLAQLSQKARAEGRKVGWMNCDRRDVDPRLFSESLIAALEDCRLDAGVGAALSDHVAANVAAITEPVSLFVDDYDSAAGAPVDEILEFIALSAPPQVSLFVACRAMPGLALTRLQLAGRIRLVDADLLRFTPQETAALMPDSLPATALQAISDFTHGWPFALQLARLRALGGARQDWPLDIGSTVPRRQIFDYLATEVLSTLSQAKLAFLADVAILECIEVGPANAIRQHDNSLALIQELSTLKPIVVMEESTWSARLHPLLRDYLLHRLELDTPGQMQARHLRAAQYFSRQHRLDDAVFHAAAAGRFDMAAQMIEDAGGIRLLVSLGESRVRLLLMQMPMSVLQSPRLRLLQVALRLVDHNASNVDAEIARVEQAFEGTQESADPALRLDLQLARCMVLLNDGEHELHFAPWATLAPLLDEGRSRFVEDPLFLALCLPVELFFLQRYGPRERCERRTEEIEHLNRAVKPLNTSAWAWLYHARNAYARGELQRCETIANDSLKRDLNFVKHSQKSLVQLVTVMLGETLLQAGRLEEALAQFSSIVPAEAVHFLEVLAGCYVDAARCEFWLGNPGQAIELLRAARHLAFEENLPHLEVLAAALQIELEIRRGYVRQATALAASVKLDAHWESSRTGFVFPWIAVDAMARARFALLLQQDDPAQALQVADRFLLLALQAGQRLSEIAALAMRARARSLLRQTDAAAADLQRALELARACGARQTFVEMGPETMAHIRALAANGPANLQPWASELVRLWEAVFARSRTAASLFTDREFEVLRELARDQTTKMIARTVMRSPETVKYHLKSIFSKLGVGTREDAVAEARRRALIP